MTSSLQELSAQILFDTIPDAMLLVDKSGYIVQSNGAACLLFGYSKAEISELKVEALMPPQYRERHCYDRDAFNEISVQRKMGIGGALAILCRNGEVLKADISLTPIDLAGQKYTLVSLREADRQETNEEALRVSEERLRLAKQAASLGVFDFGPNYVINHWGEKMNMLWGARTEQDLADKRFLTIIHPDDYHARELALSHATNPTSNGEYRMEYRVINPADGSEKWVMAIGHVFFEHGIANRLIGVARDITDKKLLEKRLQEHRSETENLLAQQVAAQTASAIAHELNQPLAAISAYSDVALHALNNGLSGINNLKPALEGCIEQAQRAGKSLHELIAFLQQGDLLKEKINLNDLVTEAVNITSNGYGNFKPELRLEENLPLVLGNKIQIQKILVNLLRNAVEAMRSINALSSPVTVVVSKDTEIKMAHITVKDCGPGLSEEITARAFEPFFTTKSTGIGMGLAISRALTEANGGKLWFESNSGSGAIFHFTLPYAS